jgi:L-ascorbate metabolism protein UlaG (beta-lactamase superfamily)
MTVDDLNILHVGDLGAELSQEDIQRLPEIDVLMIPIGDKYTINAKTATKVISSVEPSYVLPMHYKTDDLKIEGLTGLKEFLDEMGVEDEEVKEVDKLVINAKSDSESKTQVVVLKPAH